MLNVGPESAGASPGPACYGQGGVQATVTDANLVLGRLQADGFLGEGMRLNVAAAQQAVQNIALQLGVAIEAAAEGIIKIANEHMVRALRTISVQRGFDPMNFALTCFGGAGGLHVCALADALNMQRAIVPVHGGVLSALGMLVAAPSRDLSHSCIQNLVSSDRQQLENLFTELELRGIDELQEELTAKPTLQRSVDLRYQGQSFTLNVPWSSDLQSVEQAFHELHKNTYGHELDMLVELVNLRVNIKGDVPAFKLPRIKSSIIKSSIIKSSGVKSSGVKSTLGAEKNKQQIAEPLQKRCYGFEQAVSVYRREELLSGQKVFGPALILETVSTTLIGLDWYCRVDDWGNLLLQKR